MKDDVIDEYYRMHAKTVEYLLLAYTHNADLAEELTQETFYQAVKTVKNFRGECKPSVWLCQIAKNVWKQYLQKQKYRNHGDLDEAKNDMAAASNFENMLLQREEKVELYKMIHQLDKDIREVMYLRMTDDLSFAEIGEILGKTENWSRVTFYRAKQKLLKGDLK